MPIVNSNERENHGNISLINLFLKNLFSCLIKKKKEKVERWKVLKMKRNLRRLNILPEGLFPSYIFFLSLLLRFVFLRPENQPFFSIFPGLISKPVYLSQFMVHLYHSIPRTKITKCVAIILCYRV